jgi:FkbM family methyltransferase
MIRRLSGASATLLKRIRRKLLLRQNPNRLATFALTGGLKFTCRLGSSTGRILTQGDIEGLERAFVRERLKPGDVFVDIGANLGLFTLTAAQRAGPSGHVYAFEPSPREAEMLEYNVRQNGFNNVTIVRQALSDHSGEASFIVATDGGTNSLEKNPHPEQIVERREKVSLNTLDAFIADNDIRRIDMIKIDVEGGECAVLRGGATVFRRSDAPVVLSEFCDLTASGFGSSGRDLYDAWTQYGYKLYTLQPLSTNGIGLAAASRQDKYEYVNLVASKLHEPLA